MESVPKITIAGLKMTVESGLEKFILKSFFTIIFWLKIIIFGIDSILRVKMMVVAQPLSVLAGTTELSLENHIFLSPQVETIEQYKKLPSHLLESHSDPGHLRSPWNNIVI